MVGSTELGIVFGGNRAKPHLLGSGQLTLTEVPIWIESDLAETSDALYYKGASRRRGLLAPPEVGDSPNDAILVSINLKGEHRSDPTSRFTFLDDSGDSQARWRMFSDEVLGRRAIIGDEEQIYSAGYRQSYMLPPWRGGAGEADRIVPWMYNPEESMIRDFGMESMVL